MAAKQQPEARAGSSSSHGSEPLNRSAGQLERPKEYGDVEKLHLVATHDVRSGSVADIDPFGEESEGEVKYKTLKWWHAGLLLVAETVSLGVLSLPKVMATVGFLPGVALIVGLGVISTYTGYVIGQLKQKHMGIHSFADAGKLLFGSVGYWIFFAAQSCILIFVMAAHILTFSVMMNVLTEHATCTIVFTVIGTVVSFVLTLPRTSKTQAYFSIASCLSITTAIIFTMAAVGIKQSGLSMTHVVTPSTMTSFQLGAMSVSNIVAAFSGHVAFFGFISELKQPKDFPKALAVLQTVAISFYVTVAVVIYYFAGYAVKCPALNSAGPLLRKIAFGLAAPTIVIAGVVNGHIAVKTIYVRHWRGRESQDAEGRKVSVMSEKSFRARGSWYLIGTVCWITAWIVGSAIPVFSQLLGLLGAALCSWFTLGMPAIFWLWMNRGIYFTNWKKLTLFVLNVCILLVCLVVCVTGIYGSAWEISQNKCSRSPFSCADNSIE
ncbi:hypothetical protein MBLNU459_g6244t1 [Dothideomycetes sp. NU459]